MLTNHTSPLGTVLTEGGTDRRSVMLALAKAGGHVLLVDPASKAPLDLRSDVQRRKDDAAEVERTGDPNATAPTGLFLATDNTVLLERYWKRAVKDGVEPNLALHVEWSGLVLVDADLPGEVEGVQRLAGAEPLASYPLTTRSPGQRNSAGEWIHHDGGHFVFTADYEGMPLIGEFALDGGAIVSTHNRYFLVPPSSRPEGAYVNVGPVRPLSSAPWLVEALVERMHADAENIAVRADKAAARIEKRASGDDELGTTITAWNDAHPWAMLLGPDGWEENRTGKNGRPLSHVRMDNCGCPTWTAPGDHADGKSATAHEYGCTSSKVEIEGSSGPLHLWTNSRPTGLTDTMRSRWTKAQYMADVHHAGDMRAFLTAEGIVADAEALVPAAEYAFGDAGAFGGPSVAETTPDPSQGLSRDDEETFWSSSPELKTIRQFAWSRTTSPWSVLGNVLVQVAARIPHTVTLPPITGGHASLNLFVAVVGATGKGKGKSSSVAHEAISGLSEVWETELGSGEGIGHVYAKRSVKSLDTERIRYSAVLDVPEIGNMTALIGRQASTLSAVLCKVWAAEPLGNAYVDRTKALRIPKHSYRTALVVGVQPQSADALLGASATGLPQRFVWLPTNDPLFPETGTVPEPSPVDLSHISMLWPSDPLLAPGSTAEGDDEDGGEPARVLMDEVPVSSLHAVHVAEPIAEMIHENARRTLRGQATDTSLDSHRGLSWLKAAAVLSVLEGRRGDIDEDTWSRAEIIMRKSDATRAEVEAEIRRVEQEDARRRIEAAVTAQVAGAVRASSAMDAERDRKLAERVVGIVTAAGPEGVTRRELDRRNGKSRDRLDDVLDGLVAAGRIRRHEYEYRGRVMHRFEAGK